MSIVFSRTLRSLEADSFRLYSLGIIGIVILLGVWCAWFFLAEITLYEVTDKARLEVSLAAHPIDAPLVGRVVDSRLELGKQVDAGTVLVELDAEEYRIQLKEQQTQLGALSAEVKALQNEITVEQEAQQEERQGTQAALDEVRARHQEAKIQEKIAEEEAKRLKRLHLKAYISEIDHLKAQAKAKSRKAAAATNRLAVKRLESARRTKEIDRKVRIEQLKRQVTQLEGQLTMVPFKIEKLKYEIERRKIRAPIAGRIGEVAELHTGVFVAEDDRLATIVPEGENKMVAHFNPSAALGRIKPGQSAHLRVKGFPWTQYGTVLATVTLVGNETRDGRIRVEFSVIRNPFSAIPSQHGLPGTVEVEVERISPASLLLRVVGRLLTVSESSF